MRIHLLTFGNPNNPNSGSNINIQMLRDSALKRGHVLETLYAKDCQLEFVKKPRVLIENKLLKKAKIIIVKATFGGENLDFHIGTIRQFELSGFTLLNNHLSIMRTKNKVRNLQILNIHNVPIPKSYVVRSTEYISDIVKNISSYPIILKSVSGSQGAGVAIIESQRGLRSIMDMIIKDDVKYAPVIIQEYIRESSGKDIRIFVVGNNIVAAMERIASKRGEFRSNFSMGGKVRIAGLTTEEKRIALKAVRVCGLDFAGVDLIRTKTGPKILEVNSNPGLEGITQATNIDVAGKIIEYAVKKSKMKK
ncbi:MAG: RimK family alpha-L-glutamate ligase [bacterium]